MCIRDRINTHQPLEGPTSWYEVHLNSDEGTNIIGTMYPGTPNVLIGVNEHLGWSHTVNYPDKTDVFKLRMKNKRKNMGELVGDIIIKSTEKIKSINCASFRNKAYDVGCS